MFGVSKLEEVSVLDLSDTEFDSFVEFSVASFSLFCVGSIVLAMVLFTSEFLSLMLVLVSSFSWS